MAKQFSVQFKADKCKGCGLCVMFCPKKLIALDGPMNVKGYHTAAAAEQSACIGCASCALMCPDGAISIYEKEGE